MIFLRHDCLRRRIHDRATNCFIGGLSLTALGVMSAIVIGFIEIIW